MLFNRELFQAQGKEENQGGSQWGWGGSTRPNAQTEVSLEHHNHPQRASSHRPQPQAFSGTGRSPSTPHWAGEAPVSTGFGQLSPKLLGKDWLLPEFSDVALETDKRGSDPDAINTV